MKIISILMLLVINMACLAQPTFGQKSSVQSPITPSLDASFSNSGGQPPGQQFINEMHEVAKTAANSKDSLIKSATTDGSRIDIAVKGSENWSVYIDFRFNQSFACITFPCKKIDLGDPTRIQKLLEKNAFMRMSRFEIHNGQIMICTPCDVSKLTPCTLNYLLRQNVYLAKTTIDLWGKPKRQSSPTQKSSKATTKRPATARKPARKPSIGTTPTEGVAPTGFPVPQICTGDTRVGTIEIKSIKGKNFFGVIGFSPNFTCALDVRDMSVGEQIELRGTYERLDGKLRLIFKQPNSENSMYFDYSVEAIDENELVLTSKDNDKIRLPK